MSIAQIFILSLLVCHGLIHLIGFGNAFGLQPASLIQKRLSRFAGWNWLSASLLFLVTAGLFLFHKSAWATLAIVAAFLSQILIISVWKDARFGTIANVLIIVLAMVDLSSIGFDKQVNKESRKLMEGVNKSKTDVITEADLNGLPAPVKKWLAQAGIIGKETIYFVRLKQEGRMRTAPARRWMPFNAIQYFNADDPSFIWKASVKFFPGINMQGFDKFSDGHGTMQIKLLSMINVVNAKNDRKVDSATLTRYLAEMTWFPTAALSKYLRWEAIDSHTARVTIQYHGVSASARFSFNKNGDLQQIEAARYKDSGKNATLRPWIVDLSSYQTINGFRIPLKSVVTWRLKDGDFTWAEMQLTDLQYNIYQLYP